MINTIKNGVTVMKTKPLITAMAAAGLTSLLAVSSAHAVVNNDLAAVNSNFPIGVDYATSVSHWYDNPTLYAWNPVNARPGSHPDRGRIHPPART